MAAWKRWLTTSARVSIFNLTTLSSSALVNFNEGRDQLFATASLSAGYDSNIFASDAGKGDVVTTGSLRLEYLRRAGLIGVNGAVEWTQGSFASNPSEDFSDPSLSLELVKESGRTTGSFTLTGNRQSKADPALNQRTVSWNLAAGLNVKYPVIRRYSVTGTLGYGLLKYTEKSSELADLRTVSAGSDLFYAYTSERDLLVGYRIRQSDTSANNQSVDHSITGGVSGKIISKLRGSIRAGYQIREEGASGSTFGSTTASASVTWAVNRRFTITGTVSKDFGTTAYESSTDNLSFNLDAQYVIRNRWSLYAGLGFGYSDYLNGTDIGRSDYYGSWSFGPSYELNEHFKASLTYSYFQNWSSSSIANFDRHTLTLNLTSRW